ncbi:hypothetical protein HCN44_004496 [Aphidius gifuensis]|uniref:Uncharacterized protein n=1 Tax=Aphidius gifuensis TaxID=684658 RepID=A0A835CSI4_APHGI|nr:uncharacterized protein LOC122848814 [Aphidius gifuensis]XP_044003093.1 uncharacterized protein LOC122848814 [Aphidius gifuensis]KAF7995024.1 hypothetical protein HCN44_004496 [Aphidius gifuensis]
MEGIISPLEYREDCSGRSMATLLVAWLSAAMVASILLRWKYMWIALAILTILFLAACGLAAYSSRKSARDEEEEEEANRQQRLSDDRMNIQSISGDMSQNYPYNVEPPGYQTYWITELPPPYTVVVESDAPPLISSQLNSSANQEPSMDPPLTGQPPPYSVAIQQNRTSIIQTASSSDYYNQNDHTDTSTVQSLNIDTCQSVTINRNDENKEETDDESKIPPSSNVLSSGTQYLTNFISHTFGRGQRSRTTSTVIIPNNQESTTSSSRIEQITS